VTDDEFTDRVRLILDAYDEFRSTGDRTAYVHALRMECLSGLEDYLKSVPTLDAYLEQKGKPRKRNPVIAAVRQLIPDDK
jgi:hypothetical protein